MHVSSHSSIHSICLLFLQLPRCRFLRSVRTCILTCFVDVSFFFPALSFTQLIFDAVSFVSFECYGIAMTLGHEQYPRSNLQVASVTSSSLGKPRSWHSTSW